MKISTENWEDVKRYYRGTYVKFKETGDHVWKITHVDPERVLAIDDKGEEIGLDLNVGYEIEYVIPGKAAFQYGDQAYALIRIPARQFYRGMHQENTKFSILGQAGRWSTVGYDFSLIQAFVNKPSYYKIDHVLDELDKGTVGSWALSPYFCISGDGSVVTTSGTSIGKVYTDKRKIVLNKLFNPELEKLGVFNHLAPLKSRPKKVKEQQKVEADF